jgi:hypothetical protein
MKFLKNVKAMETKIVAAVSKGLKAYRCLGNSSKVSVLGVQVVKLWESGCGPMSAEVVTSGLRPIPVPFSKDLIVSTTSRILTSEKEWCNGLRLSTEIFQSFPYEFVSMFLVRRIGVCGMLSIRHQQTLDNELNESLAGTFGQENAKVQVFLFQLEDRTQIKFKKELSAVITNPVL